MFKLLLAATTAALLTSTVACYAGTTITGTYTAVASGLPGYVPYINYSGSGYLTSPFSETLVLGATSAATTFLRISPIAGSSSLGTLTGSVAVGFSLLSPTGAAVTGVTSSLGGNTATLSNGVVKVSANYELFYGTQPQTDCITWNAVTCSGATANSTTIGETLAIMFADKSVLDVNLYNWSDWTMTPQISFDLVTDPAPAPEPASLAILGAALAGLTVLRHSRNAVKRPATLSA